MKHACRTAAAVTAACLFLFPSFARAGATDSVLPCVVFLTRDAGAMKNVNFGSGFLVNRQGRPYLVTAGHVARDLGADFSMVLPGAGGKAAAWRMQGVSWKVSPRADVACTGFPRGGREGGLLARALPEHALTARPLPPSRDIPLVAVGYPLGLGAKGPVEPLSFETKAASGLITLQRFDALQEATFILLQSPSISGLSGGPVFDVGRPLVEGGRLEPREGVSLVGLVSGVIWDKTGGKLAMIVPATEITRLFQSPPPRT